MDSEEFKRELRSALKPILDKYGLLRGLSLNIHYDDAAPADVKHFWVFREGAHIHTDNLADIVGQSLDAAAIAVDQLKLHGQQTAKEVAAKQRELREMLLAENGTDPAGIPGQG